MAGRFNKLLEFIGLVDDEPDDASQDAGRSSNYGGYGSNRGGSARKAETPPPRNTRMPPRYASSARPDYDARQRRGDSYGAQEPRYGASSAGNFGAGRADYGAYRPQSAPAGKSNARDFDPFDAESEKRAQQESRREPDKSKVVPMPSAARPQPPAPGKTIIYYLRALKECRDVINDLLDGKTILLNLEDMDERVMQRAVDTLCGASFALDATIRKASDKTYLIAPTGVQIASPRSEDDERRFQ